MEKDLRFNIFFFEKVYIVFSYDAVYKNYVMKQKYLDLCFRHDK